MALIVKPLKVLEPALATYRKDCCTTLLAGGEKAIIAMGREPAMKGDPTTGVSLPVFSAVVKAETSPEPELAT